MPDAPHEYTIDELAAAAGVPRRTVRFYQSRGVLMMPVHRARVAYYGARHLERLRLIAQLQERGLRMDAIRDLLTKIEGGELDLAQWLGVEMPPCARPANETAPLARAAPRSAARMDAPTSARVALILRKHAARAVAEVVDHLAARAKAAHLDGEQRARLFETLRPAGSEALSALFGTEMERALAELATSGTGTATRARRAKG